MPFFSILLLSSSLCGYQSHPLIVSTAVSVFIHGTVWAVDVNAGMEVGVNGGVGVGEISSLQRIRCKTKKHKAE